MFNKFKIILILFFLNVFNFSYAAEKIAYIDIDFLLNESIAGKLITNKLEMQYKSDIKKFKTTENKLIDEEKKLVAQKNILSPDEYNKKIIKFKEKVKIFNEDKNNSMKILNQIKNKSTSILIKNINPIIEEYAIQNSIDIILPKNAILIAKSDLEITNEILKLLNEKIKEIKIE
jgi:outer membrane protein|tara:strand:+ start:3387 stop:3911 length:525 start_codon:yes stop_codon:yes gene_type:complete